ncbi:MAG: transposase [Blastocatellia bacterium]|nr:transposase [Blastocatellia bacterium]
MPRVPRHQSAPGAMRPGTLYHVTSHAVAGTWLFETARDRVVFLSLLAWQCRERGLVVHAFCLMGNHIHGILEDRRGQVSQVMSLVKGLYARYYNATRHGGRRRGALWAERFSAEVIDTKRYYDAAVAYVLLNPVRVKEPMVGSPEIYPWSSCAMTVGEGVTPAAYFARMVEKEGGIDAILDSMPKARNAASAENRGRRLEILVEGKEFVVDGVLGGRSREEYLGFLRAKVNVAAMEFHEAAPSRASSRKEATRIWRMMRIRRIRRRRRSDPRDPLDPQNPPCLPLLCQTRRESLARFLPSRVWRSQPSSAKSSDR